MINKPANIPKPGETVVRVISDGQGRVEIHFDSTRRIILQVPIGVPRGDTQLVAPDPPDPDPWVQAHSPDDDDPDDGSVILPDGTVMTRHTHIPVPTRFSGKSWDHEYQ